LTGCIPLIALDYMGLLMDADCLIKLTQAGLKELVMVNYSQKEGMHGCICGGKKH